jgi:hypothetical protein
MDFHDERTCAQRMERIRALNDQLRKTGLGGKLFITQAVARLQPRVMAALMLAVREFDDFGPANDPHREHDFGSVTVADQTYFWKVDVYDVNLEFGSPDPADETISRRVLTVMTAADY